MKKYLMIIAAVAIAFTACKQKPVVPPETTFDIQVSDLTATSVTITVTPSDTAVYYYFDIMKKENYDQFANDDEVVADMVEYFQELIEYYEQYGVEASLEDFMSKGVDGYDYDGISANTDYYAFAFKLDSTLTKLDGKITKVPFHTPDVPNVNLSFTTQTNDTSIWFYPNDNDVEYLIGLANADSMAVSGYANAAAYWTDYVAYMEAYAEYYGATLADLTMYGPVYATYEDLVIGGNYIFMAQAYNGGRFNSDLVTVNFTVPALASAPKMETKGQFDKKLSMKKAKKININRDIKVARK